MNISKPHITYILIFIIGLLLLFNLTSLIRNRNIIQNNNAIKNKSDAIVLRTADIIRWINTMDMVIRGYALDNNEGNIEVYHSAIANIDSTLDYLEIELTKQNFPIEHLSAFEDSIQTYIQYTDSMIHYLKMADHEHFMSIFKHDYGYNTWMDYQRFNKSVEQFENEIYLQADHNYESALNRNIYVNVMIILLAIPTSIYTAYHANRTFSISEKLRNSELQKNEILSSQNSTLEMMVKKRTAEIEMRNEEIVRQNKELSEANKIIEQQNIKIQNQNKELKEEVENQTINLLKTNSELLERIEKIEQYSFIVSHNLRAPVAQILGLAALLHSEDKPEEIKQIFPYIAKATENLDNLLKEINQILIIENDQQKPVTEVSLEKSIKGELINLAEEISNCEANIELDLKIKQINSVQVYISSIFYNLLSNALKYRRPNIKPEINITSKLNSKYVQIEVSDNGLGIDLNKFRHEIFSIYKRFHTHIEGRGLGLYLTKIQVENLGGKISIQSIPNQGSTFYITLPYFANSSHTSFITH